ncbi:hypothetical protein SGGMMB4_02702 [Sodalis glossinidius str. 'morsitans']|uniref:Head fiber protein n=1 Tax=Sodalis glossinidius (strain morsitans) TaxID=343509 RepID=A0A193QJ11_SODGM|nr:hypothetical protein [Sodalis glossinidius]CRL45156.1 hypothetical protein SGGMMB4_02702 [Sodalis glossinidius str. 'morsitans']
MAIDIEHTDKGDKVIEKPVTVKTSTDQITDASTTGKALLTAGSAANARTTLEIVTGAAIADLAAGADVAKIVTTVNAILASLRTAKIIASS